MPSHCPGLNKSTGMYIGPHPTIVCEYNIIVILPLRILILFLGRLQVMDLAEVNPELGSAADQLTTVQSACEIIEAWFGKAQQKVHPSRLLHPETMNRRWKELRVEAGGSESSYYGKQTLKITLFRTALRNIDLYSVYLYI